MPLITASKTQPEYDVIVVGSGAAGGQTAYTLTMEGAKVLMLEAGRNYDPASEVPMFQTHAQAPLRGASTPDKYWGFYDATVDGGWQIPGEPYTSASTEPGREFKWWRARMLGGRTNHWARNALRNGPYDFKPYSRDGLGVDWPVSYDDVAPYYDKVEMLIGVYGSNDGLENHPNSSPGVLHPAPKPRAVELLVQHRAKKLGIPVVAFRRAVATQRFDGAVLAPKLHPNNPKAQRILAADMGMRSPCFFATPCGRGCSIRATYQSTTHHLPAALATGNLDILPNALAREVTVDADGKATGVLYIDRTTGREERAKARVVVLAAGAMESVRVLLNSKSAQFPHGVANRSGLVGKYIMDTVGARFSGQVPLLENLPPTNDDGAGGAHCYIPWWIYDRKRVEEIGFPRGYHVEFGGGRSMPNMGTAAGLDGLTGGSYGRKFKEDMRRYYGSFVHFSCRGEMIPNEHCFCELDPTVKDRWGVPVLRFHWQWSEHELNMAVHAEKTFAEILEACGGRAWRTPNTDGRKAISAGGEIIHEIGGARMGTAADGSVTNQFGQTWDVPNLFINDGATFASKAHKNPTLTIMALAWRNSDHLLEEMRKGNI
jgi:choline dehydrogenase-like flavoprotein